MDFGRQQIKLTQNGGHLAADAKKLKLGDALAAVEKATEALAKALGRASGEKRKPPSRQLRDAVAECAASFNAVHDDLAWFITRTPKGADRDRLEALLAPLEALLLRTSPAPSAPPAAEAPSEPQGEPG